MIAITKSLRPAVEQTPQAFSDVPTVFAQLANPVRRALIKAIGYESVPEKLLMATYGLSWGAVQADLRALVTVGLIEITTSGSTVYMSLDLSSFPERTLRGLLQTSKTPSLRLAA